MSSALPPPLKARSAPLPEGHIDLTPPAARQAAELAEIRRQLARLQAREAALLAQIEAGPRPGWPMQRLPQAMGERISASSPARTAV